MALQQRQKISRLKAGMMADFRAYKRI